MTILYHHRTLGDGAEGIHIMEMVSAFRALGHDVHLMGLAASPGGSTTLAQRLKHNLPGAAFELAALASNAAEYAGMRRAIRRHSPAFLYKRHARFDLGAILAASQSGVPTVLEVNCLFTDAKYLDFEPVAFPRLAARLERRAIQLADVVLAVSTPLARAIERLAAVPVVVMPNGADPRRFDPTRWSGTHVRERYGLAQAITVGWVGVMRDWHGLDILLDAVSRLDGVRLLLVGDGSARPAVERMASERHLADRLVITGRVPQADIPQYLAAMDIAVVASDGTGVASPMKLLEYMSMQRAVVAPRLENIGDVISDGTNGLLFAAADANELCAVLRRLVFDATLRTKLGLAARERVVAERNWNHNATQVLSLIAPKLGAAEAHRG
jgi:glycosyltransferase involved in cell wall biosynthesis